MEIKRKLTAVAKRISPQIEAMNIGIELKQLVSRIEELATYGEQKLEMKAQRGGVSTGLQVRRRRDEERREVAAVQTADEQEHLADQNQSRAQPDVEAPRGAARRAADDAVQGGAKAEERTPPASKKKAKKKGRRTKKS